MKVALVHDYLNQYGGAERILEAFCELFPEAPIYTLFYDEKLTYGRFKGKDIHTSFIQKIPFSRKYHQMFPLLMPMAVESLDLSEYDLVLSDSASFAKGVITKPQTFHICYLHTPLRYAWDKSHQYLSEFPFPTVLKSLAPFFLTYLRVWDQHASIRPDVLLTNSRFVRSRIRKYYKQEADIIYPPVSFEFFGSGATAVSSGDYFLIVGRLTPYKRFQLAITVCNKLGLPLKIVGGGPERRRLQKSAARNIEFLGTVPDRVLRDIYANCRALIFPQEEDFGIVALEAMAAGKPVIAFRGGGAMESIIEGETGIFFDEPTESALERAIREFGALPFDSRRIKDHAKKFDKEIFKKNIKEFIDGTYADFISRITV